MKNRSEIGIDTVELVQNNITKLSHVDGYLLCIKTEAHKSILSSKIKNIKMYVAAINLSLCDIYLFIFGFSCNLSVCNIWKNEFYLKRKVDLSSLDIINSASTFRRF